MNAKIAYQGEPGANSHIACIEAYPDYEPLSCRTFEDAFQAVKDGEAALAMIPIDNSVAGRVADIHHLLPRVQPLHRRRALPARASPAAGRARRRSLKQLQSVHSHVHALGQCRKLIRELGLKAVVAADTAGAARELTEIKDTDARRHRNPAGRRNLRPRDAAREHRGRSPQYHALRRPLGNGRRMPSRTTSR